MVELVTDDALEARKTKQARPAKCAAATAVGLTSILGYASTVLSGWGLGFVVQHYGWNAGFVDLVGCAAIGTLLFVACWPARAHGYKE